MSSPASRQIAMSSPASRQIGDDYGGKDYKWDNAVLASDGCIYAAPCKANQILKIDPTTLRTTLVGPLIDGYEYSGCVAYKDFVYFVPFNAKQFLKFDVRTPDVVKYVGDDHIGDDKWTGGAIGNDGCTYFAPYRHRKILKFDRTNDSTSLVGEDLGDSNGKYCGAVASKDGASIYFIPFAMQKKSNDHNILKYDIVAKTCTKINVRHLVGDKMAGDDDTVWIWSGGVLGRDGCIYAIPIDSGGHKILKIDPSNRINNKNDDDQYDPAIPENPTLVGKSYVGSSWSGGVLGGDGCIYGIPRDAKRILRYDYNGTTLVGDTVPGEASRYRWSGGVCDKNGIIFAIPYNESRVLRIEPSHFIAKKYGVKNNYQGGGVGDSPNHGIDRLGHEVYAEALVGHIVSLEKTGEPVSVGLFSPWGSGKTFFWNLSKKEFEKRNRKAPLKPSEPAITCWSRTKKELILAAVFVFYLLVIAVVAYVSVTSVLPFVSLYTMAFLYFWFFAFYDWIIWCWSKIKESLYVATVITVWNCVTTPFRYVRMLFFCHEIGKWDIGPKGDVDLNKTLYIFVDFNAWTYRGSDNVWASILETIWARVREEADDPDTIDWHRAGIEKADIKLSDTPDMANKKMRMARMKLQIQRNVVITICAWAFIGFIWLTYLIWEQSEQREKQSNHTSVPMEGTNGQTLPNLLAVWLGSSVTFTSFIAGAIKYLLPVIKGINNDGIKRIIDKIKVTGHDFKQDKTFMGNLKVEVVHLFEYLYVYNARIVLFVDDLDRCDVPVAMDSLWAISLLFGETANSPWSPITSFLAVDTGILVKYIEASLIGNVNGFRYLEKIINIPFSIPPIDRKGTIDFCGRIIDQHELNVVQIYRRALYYKFKDRGFRFLVSHLVDHDDPNALENSNEKEMLSALVKVGMNMNSIKSNSSLNYIDNELLDESNVTNKFSSKHETLLSRLLENFRILDVLDAVDNDVIVDTDVHTDVRTGDDRNKNPDVSDDNVKTPAPINERTPLIRPNAAGDTDTGNNEQSFFQYQSMVSEAERKFISEHAKFLDGVPRKLKRIINVYMVSRKIALVSLKIVPENGLDFFLENLFILTVMQELCPYRTSWLLFISQRENPLLEDISTGEEGEEVEHVRDLNSLLQDIATEEDVDATEGLRLITVYERIISHLLRCLPTARLHLGADSGVTYYKHFLQNLRLKDFDELSKYAFNLPQFMMADIKMYRNHCRVIKDGKVKDGKANWVAGFRKKEDIPK